MLKSLWLRVSFKKIDIKDFICETDFSGNYEQEPVITWIGHATFLIQIGGVNILTDPVLGDAGILYKIFYKRLFKPGISANKLPNIDFVLISHNHMDHMDAESLLSLKNHKNIHFLVPKGNKRWFDKRGFAKTSEYCWWDKEVFSYDSFDDFGNIDKTLSNSQINFSFLPASHWSQRGVFDKNKTLWGSWLIEYKNSEINGFKIFFAGDTAYDQHFKEISQEYPGINIALMPIGPCEPRKFIAHHHVDAKESLIAFSDLNAEHFVPMHWGTFPLGAENFDLPLHRLVNGWSDFYESGLLDGKSLHLPQIGQKVKFSYQKSQVFSYQKSQVKEEVSLEKLTGFSPDRAFDQDSL
ncbi:MAG: Outer membrane protein romA [candidate division TM6 bacterium GW2011_GWF2_30_66]|nr:MAG: Outer membrane protein romA [candidate division TM6 bacterium GW2011_GWF2_30_66]